MTRNSKLREEVKKLRGQKAFSDNNYLKLSKKVHQQSRRMNTATEQSTQAFKQRYVAL